MSDWVRRASTRVFGTSFGASVAKLAGGSAAGQLITVAVSPILTRLFTPAQFGQFALFLSITAVLLELAGLRYPLAIPLARTRRDAFSILVLAFTVLGVTSLVVAVVSAIWHDPLAGLLNVDGAPLFFTAVCAMMIVQGAGQILQYWHIRERRFGTMAQARVAQNGAAAAGQIGLGWAGAGNFGLIAGQTLGQGVATAALGWGAARTIREGRAGFSWRRVREAAHEHRRFPMYSTWSAVANTLSVQLPVIVFSTVFGAASAGLYLLAQRTLQMPAGVVGSAVGQVFLSRAATADEDERRMLSVRVFTFLVTLGLPAVAIVALIAPRLFAFVFGDEWVQAGQMLQIISPWIFVVFLSTPLSMLPSILGRQSGEMVFQVSLLLARAVALVWAASFGDVMVAVAAFSAVSVVWFGGFIVWNLSLVHVGVGRILRILVAAAVRTVGLLVPLGIGLWLDALWHGQWAVVGAVVSLGLTAWSLARVYRRGWAE